MNRREFLANPALPALAISAAVPALKPADDEGYIRVPAVGHRVRIVGTDIWPGHIGRTGRAIQFGGGAYGIAVWVKYDRPVDGDMGVVEGYFRLRNVESIDPDGRWVLVPRAK